MTAGRGALSEAGQSVTELQLLVVPGQYRHYVDLLWKRVHVSGALMFADTGHHHTPVMLDDTQFEDRRASAASDNYAPVMEALSSTRFRAVKQELEEAYRHLHNGEGKQAIRMMFPAVETAARVLYPAEFARLTPNEVERFFRPRLEERYAGNQPAINAGRLLLSALKNWIACSQLYRHGQEIEDPIGPPQNLVVAYVNTGASLLRWLIEFSQ